MAGFVVLPPHPAEAASVRRLFSALFDIFRSGPRQAAGRRRMLQGVLFGLEIFKCLLHFLREATCQGWWESHALWPQPCRDSASLPTSPHPRCRGEGNHDPLTGRDGSSLSLRQPS